MLHFAQLDDLDYSTVYKHFVPTALLMPPLPESLYPPVQVTHPNVPAKQNSLRNHSAISKFRDRWPREKSSRMRQRFAMESVRFGASADPSLYATSTSKR